MEGISAQPTLTYRPVLLLHGLANDSSSMWLMKEWIEDALPGIFVLNIAIPPDTPASSLSEPLNAQTQYLCDYLPTVPQLQPFLLKHNNASSTAGVNFVGYSQGALLARGWIERCNNPPIYNFISLVGPHGGTFGIPGASSSSDSAVRELAELLLAAKGQKAYQPQMQNSSTIAQFWRDPFRLDDYRNLSQYLADINNDLGPGVAKNLTYKQHLASLNQLVLIKVGPPPLEDDTIFPTETEWFGTYAPDSYKPLTMRQTELYQRDWLGLKSLDQRGAIHFLTTTCQHANQPDPQCMPQFIANVIPYLNSTLSS